MIIMQTKNHMRRAHAILVRVREKWTQALSCLRSLLAGSGLRFSFGVRAWTEMEIWSVKGIYRLKLVSSENNSGFKGIAIMD